MSLVVRPARPEDAAGIIAVQGEAAAERRWIATQPEELRTAEQEVANMAKLRAEGGEAFVAEENGRVIGICGVHRGQRLAIRHNADVGLTVAASHRGRGIGRALMLAAEAWARASGVRRLTLGVFTHNERALRLYESLGYQKEGMRVGHYQIAGNEVDEILMAKRVGR